MSRNTLLVSTIAVTLVALFFVSCKPKPSFRWSQVKFPQKQETMKVGEEKEIALEGVPEAFKVTWYTSDKTIVSIENYDANDKSKKKVIVKANQEGEATLSAIVVCPKCAERTLKLPISVTK